jgi:5-methylcytosine-specific restriction endonuclease McrA
MSENQRTTGREWKWIRNEVIIRDDYECQECGALGGRKGQTSLHVHHIEPIGNGGSDEMDNLTTHPF